MSETPEAPQERSGLTTRAAMLGLVISAVAVLLALPARTYFSQQSQINAEVAAQAEQSHRIDLLRQAITSQQDPAQVQEQALQRLGYVMPGERVYSIHEDPKPSTKAKSSAKPNTSVSVSAVTGASTVPWWSRLWGPLSGG